MPRPGDIVKIAPDVVHWHGASSDSGFSHIAIGSQQNKGGVVWFGAVAADAYAENPYDDSDRIKKETYDDLRPKPAKLLDAAPKPG